SSGVINKKGIEIQNSKITRIRNTSINILGSSPAIRIGSIDFDIFNNVITGTGTQNGIEIKSSSTSANLISSNSFNNLAVGIKNFGDNGTKTMGLDLRCNLFNNSNFDIVSDNDLTPTIGNENSSAGNNFFYNSEQFGDLILTQGNFNNNGVSKYFYRNQDFEKPLNTNSSNSIFEILLSPNCLIPLPTNDQVGVFPWIYNDPPEFPQDPGDPDDDDFVPPCNWFWPPNIIPDSIPSMIIPQITPYFPNTPIDIVYDVINNSEYFSEEEIVSILENNPGVLNDDYIYWLLFKSGCFSINGANRVLHNYFESDNRIDIINQYAENYNLKYGSIRYNILESVLNGMFSESFFRICVAKKHSFKKTYDIAESYYREGRYDISLNLVEGINNVYLSDPYNIEERNKYIQIMNIIIPHLMSSSNLENITTYELGELKIIAEHDYGVATIKAREILDYYLNMIYNETPIKYLYEPISFRTENRSVIKNNFRVLISPNPVKDVLNIEFDVKFTGKKKVITIVNSSGNINLVIETIENEIGVNALNINSGIYSIMIKIDGRLVSTEKMVKI
nr:hypothetical protein [Saprospiraceae bacterium]